MTEHCSAHKFRLSFKEAHLSQGAVEADDDVAPLGPAILSSAAIEVRPFTKLCISPVFVGVMVGLTVGLK